MKAAYSPTLCPRGMLFPFFLETPCGISETWKNSCPDAEIIFEKQEKKIAGGNAFSLHARLGRCSEGELQARCWRCRMEPCMAGGPPPWGRVS